MSKLHSFGRNLSNSDGIYANNTRTTNQGNILVHTKKEKDAVGERRRGRKGRKEGATMLEYDTSALLRIVEKLAGLRICVLYHHAHIFKFC